MTQWLAYRGTGIPDDEICARPLPDPPEWRTFDGGPVRTPDFQDPRRSTTPPRRGVVYQVDADHVDLVNAALYLRRPLLITGKPGTGKSSLGDSVAAELRLGPVLRWSITSRSTARDGLYQYDAVGRLQEANLRHLKALKGDGAAATPLDIGQYIRLGPLGTALLPTTRPRVLVIDELDKSDIDLPNDLLNILEEGEFEIPELVRLPPDQEVNVMTADGEDRVLVERGVVRCHAFPLVMMTSNEERDFPPAFRRRCLALHIEQPDAIKLARIIGAHLGKDARDSADDMIDEFISRREDGDLATDQLLNAVHLRYRGLRPANETAETLGNMLLQYLDQG
jgi:MoxR-like ATPase